MTADISFELYQIKDTKKLKVAEASWVNDHMAEQSAGNYDQEARKRLKFYFGDEDLVEEP